MPDLRLPPHDSQTLDRTSNVWFSFDGRPVSAFQGDTIASALHAVGVRLLSRSFKYHRPRGLLCSTGRCANCLMTVDGVPNVRACTMPAAEGAVVRSQNAWPSLERDALSVLDRMDRLMPVGFYYKSLIRPKFLWRLAEPVIRRVAGLGEVDADAGKGIEYQHTNMYAEIAVVGGGPSGCSAAIAASESGKRVVLVDDQQALGGHIRDMAGPVTDEGEFAGVPGYKVASELGRRVGEASNVTVLTGATAIGLYEDNLLAIHRGSELIKLRADNVIVATGTQETPVPFRNNDVPGVMLGTAALRLVNRYGVKPGNRGVVVTDGPLGVRTAREMLDAGVSIAAVADLRTDTSLEQEAADLAGKGVALLPSFVVLEVGGGKWVRSITLRRRSDGGAWEDVFMPCDFVALSTGADAQRALLSQAGVYVPHNTVHGRPSVDALARGVYAAGSVAGVGDPKASVEHGRLVGAQVAETVIRGGPRAAPDPPDAGDHRGEMGRIPYDTASAGKSFVCPCEDVTVADLRLAIAEGFQDVQSLKRYSTVTMGPCQGKMCMRAVAEVLADATGRSPDDAGRTTLRPPVQPVPMGVLAGAVHTPFRRTPLHHRHVALDGDMSVVGEWLRPTSYGNAEREVRAVREKVGIIDVSTLGKLRVYGSGAPAFLDRMYSNRMSNLRTGRIRYGMICTDGGVILDDGTVTRLGDESYYVTTGSGNVDLVEEWFQQWTAGSKDCVHVTNVTPGTAAFNVAGPSARETLAEITDCDLGSDAFRYMSAAEASVAGVPARLLRIGFVGETGWEVHVPAEYAEHVWDSVLDAGAAFGIRPFGVEAQRVLRLQKKHFIPGQDTDAMSNPFEADAAWAVKMDRDDFIGREGLRIIQERGLRNKLVGFVMEDRHVPKDGVPVIKDGYPVGKITSCRADPYGGKAFGLAWVPIELSEDGARFLVWIDGKKTGRARVTNAAVYDPTGSRVRS